MKKIVITSFLVLFLFSLMATESEPSDVVGFVKYELTAGDYNMIAVPMEITFACADPANPMASDLAAEIGSSCNRLLYWNTVTSSWKTYTGASATDFAIQPGDALMVNLNAGNDVEFYSTGSKVADVSTTFAIDYNMLMLPLNHPEITLASELEASIGVDVVDRIFFWDTTTSGWRTYTGASATDFAISIGDALIIKATQVSTWNETRNVNLGRKENNNKK